ncbi:MAG: hypothetical protein ACXWCZ_07820 [Flavisolibacter sp.]
MPNPYNLFSKEYNDLFAQNILEFQKKYTDENTRAKKFVTFYPSFGIKKNEPCDFLFIGQAVKGWGKSFSTDTKIIPNSIVKEAIQYSNDYYKEDGHVPLDWVNVSWTKSSIYEQFQVKSKREFYKEKDNDYVAYRSFFWKVAYKLISDYYGDLDRNSWGWSKRMIWSNLYKIAPEHSNPNCVEQNIQRQLAIELVKKEINEANPKYCIVLANKEWWEPFGKELKTHSLNIPHTLSEIVFFGKYNSTKILVTTRPWKGNNGEKHVQQLLELIKT